MSITKFDVSSVEDLDMFFEQQWFSTSQLADMFCEDALSIVDRVVLGGHIFHKITLQRSNGIQQVLWRELLGNNEKEFGWTQQEKI